MRLKNIIAEMQKEKIRKQKQKRTEKMVKIAASMAVTGIAGMVSGVLLAPKSGKELREDIAKTANELSENARNNVDIKKEKISTHITETRNKINEYVSSKKEKKETPSTKTENLENQPMETEGIEEQIIETA